MLAILLDHTEIYYTGANIVPYDLYVADALVIFFFLSGYLMYKGSPCRLSHRLGKVCRSLLLPYFIFTTVMALPKALAHGVISLSTVLDGEVDGLIAPFLPVLLGQASWFIAALAVGEVVFSLLLWISRGKAWLLCTLSVVAFLGSAVLSEQRAVYPWQVNNGLQAVLFLCAGWFWHRWEPFLHRFHTLSSSFFLFVLLIGMKVYAFRAGVHTMLWPIAIGSYPLFLADAVVSVLLAASVSRHLPVCRPIEWVGAHSIVYYFLCGGIPLCVSILLQWADMGYQGQYYRVLAAYAAVCAFSTLAVWAVYRYLPFITGKMRKQDGADALL